MAVISRWGNSQGIRIPKAYLEKLGLKVGDRVQIEVEGGKLVISPVRKEVRRPRLTVEELFEGTSDYSEGEFPWGREGKEVW